MAKEEETQDEQEQPEESEETTVQADASQEEAEESEESSDSEEEGSSQDDDLRAELEKERKRREKAEEAAARNAYRARKEKREEQEESYEDDEDRPLTKKDLEILRQDLTRQQQEEKANQLIAQMAASDIEAELIREVYENRITPTGDLKEDIEAAYAIANRRKILQQSEEAKRSVASRDSESTRAASSTRKKGAAEPQSSTDVDFLKRQGYQWNPTSRRYEGKATWYDPKTGQSGNL